MSESQLCSAVLMVRPQRFVSNPETAASNRFQRRSGIPADKLNAQAQAEFDGLVAALTAHGIQTVVVDDTPSPHTPDSLFPNNWLSTHADGRAVLYPMEAVNRRAERRLDVIERLTADHGFHVSELLDLSDHEQQQCFLEGTGSLVLDRVHRVAYAGLSSRTHLTPLADFAQRLHYELVTFNAVDNDGAPIYHTNVMMSIGEQLAIVCRAAITDLHQQAAVLQQLEATGRQVIAIDYTQLLAFAGNMLELRNRAGERVLAMSQQAFDALQPRQLALLRENGHVLAADIRTIEASAGGSVRCMLAEIHLPRSKSA